MNPQQELFIALKLGVQDKGQDVYDGFLPPANTPYPFTYLGDMQQVDNGLKNAVIGSVYLTIHVFHNDPGQRGTVSQMLLDIITVCRSIGHTANFSWSVRNVTQRIIPDNTTKTPLLHGVLEVEFVFS